MYSSILSLLVLGALYVPPQGWDELTPMTVPLESKGFEKIAQERGVTVYRDGGSDIIRLAAEARFSVAPEKVRDVLLDYGRQPVRLERVAETKVLSKGPGWVRVYQRLNMPIIDDRDYTLTVIYGENNGVLWIKYWADNKEGPPPRPGVVRVDHHYGSWQLSPLQEGRSTQARYQMIMDPAGLVPRWMAKATAGSEVPLVFENVCSMLDPAELEDRLCIW